MGVYAHGIIITVFACGGFWVYLAVVVFGDELCVEEIGHQKKADEPGSRCSDCWCYWD